MNAAPAQRSPIAQTLRWSGLLVILACACLRASLSLEPLPHWDLDPARVVAIPTGIGPAGLMLLDAITLLAAAAILLGEHLRTRLHVTAVALFSLGALGVLIHGLRGPGVALEHLRLGSSWIAAFATALALVHAARDERPARLAAAVCTGFVAVLAAKGALEVYIEHPITVANFRANREAFLAAHGWGPDSASARSFERRLSQPEASGWFGLANVYTSFAAATTVALAGLTALAWRLTRRPAQLLPDGIAGIITLGLAAACIAAWMAGSKAGVAVSGFGIALLALAFFVRARSITFTRLAPIAAAAAIALPLLAVSLRGLIGERIGELSVLFRSFYFLGASRIIAANPVLGVGPAGFKDAYMLAKPPISPEDVTSPHSIFFDLTSTLGLFGLAWAALFILWTIAAARTLLAPAPVASLPTAAPDESHDRPLSPARLDAWAVILISAPCILLSALFESGWYQQPVLLESVLARLLGLIGWVGLAIALLSLMRLAPHWRTAAAAAALALAAHAQIEMTPIWPNAAPFFMAFIGIAAARPAPLTPSARPRLRGLLAAAAPLPFAALILILGAIPAAAWERHLADAADALRPVASLRERLSVFNTPRPQPLIPGGTPARIHAEVLALLGSPQPPQQLTPAILTRDLDRLFLRQADPAARALDDAAALFPTHTPTLAAASRLALESAVIHADLGDAPASLEWADRAEHLAQQASQQALGRVGSFGWLASVRRTRADLTGDPTHLARAIEAWEAAAALDPHGPTFPAHLANANQKLGRETEARRWARRLLEIDAQLRLDPLLQLPPAERARFERMAAD